MSAKAAHAKGVAARPALIAAYREGLALACIAIIGDAGTVRIAALAPGEPTGEGGEAVLQRFWCRRAAHAEAIVGAARRRRRNAGDPAGALASACAAITAAAKRLAVSLQSDQELDAEATAAIARLDEEMQQQMRAGALKPVNRAYRDYRLAAAAGGEKCTPYAQWLDRYKANLMREIAANLRYL